MDERKATESCDCGNVVFDLTGKKAGAMVVCPWCGKRYEIGADRALHPSGCTERSDAAAEVKGREGSADAETSGDGRDAGGARKARISGRRASGRRAAGGACELTGRGREDSERSLPRRPSHVEARERRQALEISPGKIIRRVFVAGAAIYILVLLFMVATGEAEVRLKDFELFGVRVSGRNPILWITAAAFFALISILAWAAHTYFFIYRRRVGSSAGSGASEAEGGEAGSRDAGGLQDGEGKPEEDGEERR